MSATTPFGPWNPGEFFRSWMPAQLAPEQLVQPILPGWTFNINSHNSSSPHTEVNVVACHSYGRQIGRMGDALQALIVQMHGKAPLQEPFEEFLQMWREIQEVKADSAVERLERIRGDLQLLRQSQPQEYGRLKAALRELLSDAG